MGANADLIRRLFEAFAAGDLEAAFADVAPDAEIIPARTLPWGGRYTGPDGYAEMVQKISANFEKWQPSPREIWEVEGDQVLVRVDFTGTTKTGNAVEGEVLWLYRISDGRITRAEAFTDTARLLEALG